MNTKYQNGKIYKITCNVSGLVYYGSTCKELKTRLRGHLWQYEIFKRDNKKPKVMSFDIFDNGDYTISLLENFSCNDKRELCARESMYILNNECVNKIIPCDITKREHFINRRKEQHRCKGILDEMECDDDWENVLIWERDAREAQPLDLENGDPEREIDIIFTSLQYLIKLNYFINPECVDIYATLKHKYNIKYPSLCLNLEMKSKMEWNYETFDDYVNLRKKYRLLDSFLWALMVSPNKHTLYELLERERDT